MFNKKEEECHARCLRRDSYDTLKSSLNDRLAA